VSIIRSGRIVAGGTLASLRHLTRTEISFSAGAPGTAGAPDTAALAARPEVHDLTVAEGRVKFGADSDQVARILPLLGSMDVQGLLVSPPSLEELFLRHYGDTTGVAPEHQDEHDDGRSPRRHRAATRAGA
jgi:ABC-2 type transport system ATP-binding protein